MSGIFVIRDRESHKFWTGEEWNNHHSDAKMYHHLVDAIGVAKQLKNDAVQHVEVVDGYDFTEPNVRWSG